MFVRELLNGTVKATYLVGPRGPEYRRDDQAGTIRWYVYDGLGSVVGEVAPDGTLTRSQSFDVYGCVRTSSGTATTKHKFLGALSHPSDDETGLIYMRARHYDPVCGRFVSEDPACDGKNWFAYCAGNPVGNTDQDGKSFEDVCKLFAATYLFLALITWGNQFAVLWAALRMVWYMIVEGVHMGQALFGIANDAAKQYAPGSGEPVIVIQVINAASSLACLAIGGATIAAIATLHTLAIVGALWTMDDAWNRI
jgi:RHS repeat-associated protein